MVKKLVRKIGNKKYGYTGRYSRTKDKAKQRAEKARKNMNVRVVPCTTVGKAKSKCYLLFAEVKKSGKGYTWKYKK
jgi:hypothetical protein